MINFYKQNGHPYILFNHKKELLSSFRKRCDPKKLEYYIKQLIGWCEFGIELDSCLPIFALYAYYYNN